MDKALSWKFPGLPKPKFDARNSLYTCGLDEPHSCHHGILTQNNSNSIDIHIHSTADFFEPAREKKLTE